MTLALTKRNVKGSAINATENDANMTAIETAFNTELVAIGWTIEYAKYATKSVDVSNEEPVPTGLTLSSDGTKMYVVGQTNDTVYRYTLSTAWDLSTAGATDQNFSVAGEEATPAGLVFGDSGTKMYVVGDTNDTVYQYTLTTAWDLSTAAYASKSKSVTTEETVPTGLTLSSDGTKLYVVGSTNDTVYRYTLSTGWDVSTAGATDQNFSVASEDTSPQGLTFSSDGTKLYITGNTNDTLYRYTLSTAWDLSTAGATDQNFSVAGEEATPTEIAFGDSGTKMYVVGNTNDTVYQYSSNVVVLQN